MPLLLLVLGCAPNITALYDAERVAALATPAPPTRPWTPELRLRLSEEALGDAAAQVVAAGVLSLDETYRLDNPLGLPLEARPTARVKRLDVAVGEDCGGCLLLDGDIQGRARWKAGPASGTVPFTAQMQARMVFKTVSRADGWDVQARVVEIGRLRVQAGPAQALDLAPIVRGWLTDALEEAPPLQVGRVGGKQLPLRALRISESNQSVEIQALTDVAGGRPVPASSAAPDAAWDLRMHPDTVLALMRRTAFEEGPGEFDVAIDPRSLSVDGADFTLGMRVWRLKGAGWWRDYAVQGKMHVQKGRLRFTGEEALEGERSRGAGLADPLALLGERRILRAVEDGVDHSIRARQTLSGQDVGLAATAEQVTGTADALVLSGRIEVHGGSGPRKARQTR